MKTFVSVVLVSLFILSAGCRSLTRVKGDGNLLTKEMELTDYEGIEISGNRVEVIYTQKDHKAGLIITTDSNVYHAYDFVVKDQRLYIEPKKEYEGAYISPTTFLISTHSKKLNYIASAGKVVFNTDAPIRNEELEIDLAGKCIVNLKDTIHVDRLNVEMAGSCILIAKQLYGNSLKGETAGKGTLELGGIVENGKFEIAGKGNIYAYDLLLTKAHVEIAGKGNVELHATEDIRWDVAGIGKLRYKGNPQHIHKEVAGFGSVKPAVENL
ncbi:MAG: DUF2807 domain-containing protein [Tannerellaceae bacterium]|nr:DUF2807 domain-containing protein [Tannerellaceae bacterium]